MVVGGGLMEGRYMEDVLGGLYPHHLASLGLRSKPESGLYRGCLRQVGPSMEPAPTENTSPFVVAPFPDSVAPELPMYYLIIGLCIYYTPCVYFLTGLKCRSLHFRS